MKLLISAAEVSSDAHGAELLRALREEAPDGVGIEAFGIGGPKLRAAGLRSVVDARELLSMGFTEILGRLPRILGALRLLSEAAAKERPAAAIVIDYPDFHFRLARKLRASGVPALYYIPPKVWAWRKNRVFVMKELFARILCIFPFEEGFYRREGVPVRYVGNPLVDELPLSVSREEARRELGIAPDEVVLVVMPGSRPSELKRHVPLIADAASSVARRLRDEGKLAEGGRLTVLMPLPVSADPALEERRFRERRGDAPIRLVVSRENSALCLLAADAGVIKSGTSTLEAALLRCPHVVIYRTSWLSGLIFRWLIRYSGPVGLVNLIRHGETPAQLRPGSRHVSTVETAETGISFAKIERSEYVCRELLLGEATAQAVADETCSLLTDPGRRQRMLGAFDRIREAFGVSADGRVRESASRRAAREILDFVMELYR